MTVLILFNWRRQGEVSKMVVLDYSKGNGSQSHNKDVLEGLTRFEKALCEILTHIEITGKRGCLVPVRASQRLKGNYPTISPGLK